MFPLTVVKIAPMVEKSGAANSLSAPGITATPGKSL